MNLNYEYTQLEFYRLFEQTMNTLFENIVCAPISDSKEIGRRILSNLNVSCSLRQDQLLRSEGFFNYDAQSFCKLSLAYFPSSTIEMGFGPASFAPEVRLGCSDWIIVTVTNEVEPCLEKEYLAVVNRIWPHLKVSVLKDGVRNQNPFRIDEQRKVVDHVPL